MDRDEIPAVPAPPLAAPDAPAEAASCTDERTGAAFCARPGQALLDAAGAAGLDLPHGCRSGTCGACAVEILQGAEHLDPPDPIEADSLDRYRMRDCERLACRATTRGPVVLRPLD